VLHGVRARHDPRHRDAAHAWLAQATSEDLDGGPGAGLWFGASAVALALSVAAPDRYPATTTRLHIAVTGIVRTRLAAAHARIDAAVRPSLSEFDLVRGLTGLGAYLLHRDPHGDQLPRVLSYLVRLTEPVGADDPAGTRVPGWWTSDIPHDQPDPAWKAGHGNAGMAHGISGPLTLLAHTMRHGITVAGHADAIDRITDWLDTYRQDNPAGAWWPERLTLTDHDTARPHQPGPARPSWCYGTPGLARAQQLAAIARHDAARQDAAEHALLQCLRDPTQLATLTSTAICHGWAGLVLTTCRIAADARTTDLAHHLPALSATLLDRARDAGTHPRTGLIEGSAGVALTLHHLITGTGTADWLTCLLLG
jgi:hypothetical protein